MSALLARMSIRVDPVRMPANNEMYAYEMHAHEVHACKMHAHEMHAHEMHAHEMYESGKF
jgi:hypothetical protein